MKRTIAIFLILTLALSLAACAGEQENAGGQEVLTTPEPMQIDESFFIDIENQCDDEIYGVSCDYKLGTEIKGTQGAINADNSMIAKGDTLKIEITPQDLGEGADVSTFCADIYVLREDGSTVEAGGIAPIVEGGQTYGFVLTGSAGEGYVIDMK